MMGNLSVWAAIAEALLGAGAVAVVGMLVVSGLSGISLPAWLVLKLTPFLAPDFSSPDALARAIEQDRTRGAAMPAKWLLRRFEFRDESRDGDRVLRLSRKEPLGDRSCLLYLHGGAYVLDLQSVQWTLIAGLLTQIGHEVVAPIYPLAPECTWSDGLAAVRRVYHRLVGKHGRENIVLCGDSAGGGLALMLVQTLRDAAEPLPAAVVLFSPWLDIGVCGEDQPALEKCDPALTIGFLRAAGRLWAKGLSPSDSRVSPLFGDHHGLPATILFSGTRNILDSDALRLAKANPLVDHRHYRNMIHVWPAAPIPEARRALDEAAAFIRTQLSGA
jgi:monoterpene epsilon-lactone hydrolase